MCYLFTPYKLEVRFKDHNYCSSEKERKKISEIALVSYDTCGMEDLQDRVWYVQNIKSYTEF